MIFKVLLPASISKSLLGKLIQDPQTQRTIHRCNSSSHYILSSLLVMSIFIFPPPTLLPRFLLQYGIVVLLIQVANLGFVIGPSGINWLSSVFFQTQGYLKKGSSTILGRFLKTLCVPTCFKNC